MTDDEEDFSFESADAGSSMTATTPCSSLRTGGHVVIKNRPCKIVEKSTSATGKHGQAKAHLIGIDIFTSKKLEDVKPLNHDVDVPNISRKDYSLLGVTEDNVMRLADASGVTKDDLKVPEGELSQLILDAAGDEGKHSIVTVVAAMGEEGVVALKEGA